VKKYFGWVAVFLATALVVAFWFTAPRQPELQRELPAESLAPSPDSSSADSTSPDIHASPRVSLDQFAGKSDAVTLDLVRRMSAEQRKTFALRLTKTSGNLTRIAAFFKAWGEVDSYAAFQASKDFQVLSQRESALRAIFEGVTPENASQLLNLLASLQPGSISGELPQVLLGIGVRKWAQIDPVAAADFLSRNPDRNQINQAVYNEIGKQWAEIDPKAALAWAENQDKRYQQNIMLAIVQSWIENDPQTAVVYWRQRASEDLIGISNALTVANALAANDPAGAKAFAESLPPGEARNQAVLGVAIRLAHDDPAGTANWVTGLSIPQAVVGVMMHYAVQDPQGARQWIDTLPPESRDTGLSTYALNVRDNADGILTALQIADDKIRTETVSRLADRWRALDADGFVKWISSSGLPPATQDELLKRR